MRDIEQPHDSSGSKNEPAYAGARCARRLSKRQWMHVTR